LYVNFTFSRPWFVSNGSGQLERAFESTLHCDTQQIVNNFTEFLKNVASFDASSGFTSLYVAMVQSSGSGKTRFALEIPRLLSPSRVAYLCLREPNSSGALVFSHFLNSTANMSFSEFRFILVVFSRRRLSSSE
jgi:hypothetical protein